MLDPQAFVASLRRHGVEFFTGVPDSLLKELCACVTQTSPPHQHIIAANEGGSVALAIGYHLATGRIPLVYLQNSGLGNVVNPLLSLADPDVYSVPMLLLVGWRGEPGVHDEPQHKKQGRVMGPLLEAMEIPCYVLGPDLEHADGVIHDAVAKARSLNGPVALLVKSGTFHLFKGAPAEPPAFPLSREDAIRLVIGALGEQDIVVSTTGMISREVFECRVQRGEGHHRDFLTVGGMGHASQIALGIALQKPERRVCCLDGDGALLMHLGALCITGSLRPANFLHIVLNNGAHDSVGGQPTVGLHVDLGGFARAAGYAQIQAAETAEAVRAHVCTLATAPGPNLLEIRVRRGARKDLGRPTTKPVENKAAFMGFLSGTPRA